MATTSNSMDVTAPASSKRVMSCQYSTRVLIDLPSVTAPCGFLGTINIPQFEAVFWRFLSILYFS